MLFVNYTSIKLKNFLFKKLEASGQDGSGGGRGVRVSPKLGRLPDASGGPEHLRRQEEPLSDQVGRRESERGGTVKAGQD